MADPRSNRHAYLERVAGTLQLPDPVAGDILDELGAHIADTTNGLIEEGLTPEQAEREALARLGDPIHLGDGIRRAKQTRRRLMVAAGFGVVAAVRGFFWGWLFAAAVAVLAGVLATLLISLVVQALGITSSGSSWDSSWLTAPYLLFALGYAGHQVPTAIAARSLRPVRVFRGPVAVVGGGLIGMIAIFGLRLPMDAGTVAILALAGPAFAIGSVAVTGAEDRWAGRIMLGVRSVTIAVLVLTAGYAAVGFATMQVNPGDGLRYMDTTETIGPVAYDVLPEATGIMGGGTSSGGVVSREFGFDPPVVPAGWTGFRMEAWREGPWVNGSGPILPGETAPVATAPMSAATDPGSYSGELVLPVTKSRMSYTIAITGLGPDGRRYVLSGPDTGMPGPAWVGTAWGWLTTL